MTELSSEMVHATTVAIDGRAVVIEGRSGSGKSDLALRLIDRGAVLVSDDQTLLVRANRVLTARAPDTIAGQMELRGIGIVSLPHAEDVPVALIVRLDADVPRLPERRARRICGVEMREIVLDPLPASAPIKVEMALRQSDANS